MGITRNACCQEQHSDTYQQQDRTASVQHLYLPPHRWRSPHARQASRLDALLTHCVVLVFGSAAFHSLKCPPLVRASPTPLAFLIPGSRATRAASFLVRPMLRSSLYARVCFGVSGR